MAHPANPPAVLAGLSDTDLVRTLVWELPVRAAHWLIVAALVVLSFTGVYIHKPFLPSLLDFGSVVAWMRFSHVLAGFVLISALVLRIYWFFKGNLWARWSAFVPVHRDQWDGIGTMLEFYLFLRFQPKHVPGHNALAALSYLVIYILFIVEVLTGLALMVSVVGTAALREVLGWLPEAAPLPYVRQVHFYLTFVFIAFGIFHLYLSVLVSIVERNGLLDSIVSGYKFVPVAELRNEMARLAGRHTYVKQHLPLPRRAPGEPVAAVRPAPTPVTLYHNGISYAGSLIAAVGLVVFLVLLLYHTVGGGFVEAPYGDLVVFIAAPALVVVGVVVLLVGMYVQWLRWRHGKPLSYERYPRWDLNVAEQRRALLLFAMGGVILLGVSLYAGIGTYAYTESDPFCGRACHVMLPERTTHLLSPHARVECAECHVAPGAGGYVAAKSRGLVELYHTLRDSYPRPIPTPLKALQPIRQTCEHCHWPEQFFGGSERRLIHYLPDEQNTRWEIDLLVLVGSGRPGGPHPLGIHWHVANRVEYVAADEQRRQIPWVRAVNLQTGVATVYTAGEVPKEPVSERTGTTVNPLVMVCIDCHNRPTHVFEPASRSVDRAMASGDIDPALPYIRREAVAALAESYEDREIAHVQIRERLARFYAEKYADVAGGRRAAIQQAIASTLAIYDSYFFPSMEVRWDTYPNHASHFISPGCHRCHDGEHRSEDGRFIGSECNTCHLILLQGTPGSPKTASSREGLVFQHPVDIGMAWMSVPCFDCHTGGPQ